MATINNVLKAIEALKLLNEANTDSPNNNTPRKDKVSHCLIITEGLCSSVMKVAPKFPQVLGASIETMLVLCDDTDSDVRMIADECLNKIIRAASDGHIVKIQLELYNEMKKNGSARTLRAALSRFALLSSTIRMIKRKAYTANIVPCIVAITNRTEHSVIETLSQSLPMIFKSLGVFMTDQEVKILLQAFFKNISSTEAVLRRAAASMIVTTCINCRKPESFLRYALNQVIDAIIPIGLEDNDPTTVMGVFVCLRMILYNLRSFPESEIENEADLNNFLSIYELCLHYVASHADHNVLNAALETLTELLKSPTKSLTYTLLSKTGIIHHRIFENEETAKSYLNQTGIPPAQTDEDSLLSLAKSKEESKSETLDVDDFDESKHRLKNTNEVPGKDNMEENKILPNDSQISIPRTLNVGFFTEPDISVLYCARYLTSTFLLTGQPGQLMPEQSFRVSVKSLVLACIGHLVRLHPSLLLMTVAKNSQQAMSDVLLFAHHSDPQIRGNISMIIGNYLKSALVQSGGSFENLQSDAWNSQMKRGNMCLENLIQLLLKGLKDDSATTCRQTLSALSLCLSSLLESSYYRCGITILTELPSLVGNPYFLVKITLLNLLSELSYATIEHVTGNSSMQEHFIDAMITLLGDHDPRVRSAACNSIVKSIPQLYFYHLREDAVTRKASEQTDHLLSMMMSANTEPITYKNKQKLPLHTPVKPFAYLSALEINTHTTNTEASLSRIIGILTDKLMVNSSKHFIYGYCECLSQLSEIYPTILYYRAWDCVFPKSSDKKSSKKIFGSRENNEFNSMNDISPIGNNLLGITISLLCYSNVSMDLSTHRYLITLAGNLASGLAIFNLRSFEQSHTRNDNSTSNTIWYVKEQSDSTNTMHLHLGKDETDRSQLWGMLKDEQMQQHMGRLLTHIYKVLNIFVHVIDEVQQVPQTIKSTLSSLSKAPTLSPKKKVDSTEQKIKEKPEKMKKEPIGNFLGSPHYMRFHDILKAAHSNYLATLDSEASEMYVSLLTSTLNVLSQILEIASFNEAGKTAKEVLANLQTTIRLSPTASVQCVQQLLKCLFGMNLINQMNEMDIQYCLDKPFGRSNEKGFYEQCFQKPAKLMTETIKAVSNNCRGGSESDTGWLSILRRKNERKFSSILKGFSSSMDQKTSVASYIRLFEPMVIKSLEQYTVTNCIPLQCQVLMLISQLVQLRVNYCLLDSDKIFIGYILRQFEFIEAGYIPKTEELLPKIFDFFVHLSYEKHHSKIIIDIPKILQLCDGLMASEQPSLTSCVPALIPVVEDIFLFRGTHSVTVLEQKELDTTREVLISMLLRLVEHYQVVELLALCLTESRYSGDGNGEEKWRKWSRLAIDTILPMLINGNINLECEKAHNAFVKLFASVSPTVFRPVDPLLKVLFAIPNDLEESMHKLKRWLGTINVVLLSLISYAKEETMLARLSDIRIHSTSIMRLFPTLTSNEVNDPLNAFHVQSSNIPPEIILARFIFKIIGMLVCKIHNLLGLVDLNSTDPYSEFFESSNDNYLINQFSFFLQLCIHMFESGSHCKVANASMQMICDDDLPNEERLPLNDLNVCILKIGDIRPILLCQWAYLMTLLGYNKMSFWSKILGTKENPRNLDKKKSNEKINTHISRRGGVILFCDYIEENLNDTESLSWFLMNHIEQTVSLLTELPVVDLLATAIHRNAAASGMLVQAIATECTDFSRPSFVKQLLQCVDAAHNTQSGAVISMLIPTLFSTKYLTLSRMAGKIASRRIEILLTMNTKDVIEQISKEEITKLMSILETNKLIKKHPGFISLLNKLAIQHFNLPPLEFEHQRPFDPSTIRHVQIDQSWFLSQTVLRCCSNSGHTTWESAKLLSYLEFDDCLHVLSSDGFDLRILKDCFELGARLTIEKCQRLEFEKTEESMKNNLETSPLYSAAKQKLLEYVKSIGQLIPTPHEVYASEINQQKSHYLTKFLKLLEDDSFWNNLVALVPATIAYVRTLWWFNKYQSITIDTESEEDFAKLGILCLEATHWMIDSKETIFKQLKFHVFETFLICAHEIFRHSGPNKVLEDTGWYSRVCSAVAALTKVVEYLLTPIDPLPKIETSSLKLTLDNEDTRHYAKACSRMGSLIMWLEKCTLEDTTKNIPNNLFNVIKHLIVSISRQPLINSFVLVPPLVWKNGFQMDGFGPTRCQFTLPSDSGLLQENEVLEQFVYRLNLLGWTSRLQFEEIWMALLGVLNISPSENIPMEETHAMIQSSCLAVRAITGLLMQTLLLPRPGWPSASVLIHHPRDPQLSVHKISSQKLYIIQDLLTWKYEQTYCNGNLSFYPMKHIFDRENVERNYPATREIMNSQLSIPFLWSQCNMYEDKLCASVIKLNNRRNEALMSASLDLDSCLRFLLELYGSWISPQSNNTSTQLLTEMLKSILVISELFAERAQYQWMLDVCLELSHNHPPENTIIHQYLIVAICKAAAVLTPLNIETLEKIKRLLDTHLKSSFLAVRVLALHGLLYLLQSAILTMCDETMNIIHPLAIEYIQKHIDSSQMSNRQSHQSEEHQTIMWALVFFLLEHAEDTPPDNESPAVLDLAVTLVTTPNISNGLHRTILQGLERLIVTKSVIGNSAEQIAKVSIDCLKHPSPSMAIPALQLLLTCMYTEAADRLNTPEMEEPLPDVEPDALTRSIERTSAIFDRIKRGNAQEVDIFCTVLSDVLGDFFPPSEILTKVVGEFLSPQQPHPGLLSAVVFKVCEKACTCAQMDILQEWVVFSLPNFIQSLPISISTWCLACFFISTSTNKWLRSIFPHVQSRIGKYEYEDKKILCISASDFYHNLPKESQKKSFFETFEAAAKQPGSPFGDILTSF